MNDVEEMKVLMDELIEEWDAAIEKADEIGDDELHNGLTDLGLKILKVRAMLGGYRKV